MIVPELRVSRPVIVVAESRNTGWRNEKAGPVALPAGTAGRRAVADPPVHRCSAGPRPSPPPPTLPGHPATTMSSPFVARATLAEIPDVANLGSPRAPSCAGLDVDKGNEHDTDDEQKPRSPVIFHGLLLDWLKNIIPTGEDQYSSCAACAGLRYAPGSTKTTTVGGNRNARATMVSPCLRRSPCCPGSLRTGKVVRRRPARDKGQPDRVFGRRAGERWAAGRRAGGLSFRQWHLGAGRKGSRKGHRPGEVVHPARADRRGEDRRLGEVLGLSINPVKDTNYNYDIVIIGEDCLIRALPRVKGIGGFAMLGSPRRHRHLLLQPRRGGPHPRGEGHGDGLRRRRLRSLIR